MRCDICDYSHSLPSIYQSGLQISTNSRAVRFDRKVNKYLCDNCFDEAYSALAEMINEDEEYVFNAIEPTVKKKEAI